MDCPNCGVYNPEGREVCWRCDVELPKPVERKRRGADPARAMRWVWLAIGLMILIWIVVTWFLPVFLGTTP